MELRSQLLRAGSPGDGVVNRAPRSLRSLWRPLSQPSSRARLYAGSETRRQVPPSRSPRQRQRVRQDQDTFHRRVLPPPLRLTPGLLRAWLAPHPLRGHGITDNLAPGRDVSTTKPAAGALSPPEHEAGWPDPGGFLGELAARCEWDTWTGRRSSNSATRTIHKHNPWTARSPARPFGMTHPACAGLGEDS